MSTTAYGHAAAGVTQTLIARFMGPTWGPSGADRTQVHPMLAPWTLLSGNIITTTKPKALATAGLTTCEFWYLLQVSHLQCDLVLWFCNMWFRKKNILKFKIYPYVQWKILPQSSSFYLQYLYSIAYIIISPVSEGSRDVMVLRRSRPPPAMVLTR